MNEEAHMEYVITIRNRVVARRAEEDEARALARHWLEQQPDLLVDVLAVRA